jgi:plasmid segregation protein ParM
MSETIIIGVDHGYAAMKTSHFSFPTGLVEYEHEPYTSENVLEYGGKYYVVGSGRQPLQKDKTLTEDYYLLTLAAIAKELAYRNADRTVNVHLAAGLPLTSFGRDKKRFRDYLLREGKPILFSFEGIEYQVTITEVSLFPQGYAAVLTQTGLLDEPSVIVADIGGWTVDLMRLDNRIPNAATCRSLESGMIRCLDEISEQLRRSLGLSMTAAQIESVLHGGVSSVDENAKQIIHREAGAYVHRLLSAIAESGLDVRAMPAIFLGGGAALMKRHVTAVDSLCRPIILDDVCLNAKGYERLAGQLSKGADGG